jgi:hypothetical protein
MALQFRPSSYPSQAAQILGQTEINAFLARTAPKYILRFDGHHFERKQKVIVIRAAFFPIS